MKKGGLERVAIAMRFRLSPTRALGLCLELALSSLCFVCVAKKKLRLRGQEASMSAGD